MGVLADGGQAHILLALPLYGRSRPGGMDRGSRSVRLPIRWNQTVTRSARGTNTSASWPSRARYQRHGIVIADLGAQQEISADEPWSWKHVICPRCFDMRTRAFVPQDFEQKAGWEKDNAGIISGVNQLSDNTQGDEFLQSAVLA